MRSGEHARLLPSVADAARAHPLDERLAGQLMLALYRCDRQADALAHFHVVQQRLADELGSDPGPTLRGVYQQILRHDQELAAPTGVSGPATHEPGSMHADAAADGDAAEAVAASVERSHRPAQLPLDAAGFTGRANELRRLDELLRMSRTTWRPGPW
ncbi:BTAD domain-containing putative transcriptional regulator [Promicromonospora sp. NPDC057138]|uniref:AfsR/SARP family transcriptional regulator n=1 Tax=Promicromonospora sp. NPDC057138 TaxID=3346031 RepID=UPI00363F8D3A